MNNFKLVNGDKITFFKINGLAMTTKREVIVVKETEDEILFKESARKRKVYALVKDKVPLLFLGHNIMVGADSDGNCMRGNACINLVSRFSNDDIKLFIKENNKATMTEDDKAHILHFSREQANDSNYEENKSNCLYLDTDSSSSLINSIREKEAV